jgi:hypothetical membrane protein
MPFSDSSKAGALWFLGVTQFALVVIIGEAIYPGYNIGYNHISDLGPPCSGGSSCPSRTSWLFFDASVVILGVAIITSAYFINRYFRWKPFTGLTLAAGLGAAALGVFNESSPYRLHELFSLVAFLSIGLAAVLAFWLQKPPLSYFSVLLGLISLVSLVLYIPDSGVGAGSYLGIGPGGLERLIVYPVLFWGLAFSGHLMAVEGKPSS